MPHPKFKARLFGAATAFAFLVTGASVIAPAPVAAAIVYDPTNHIQNVLTAARALEQIRVQTEQLTAQIRSLAKSPYDHSAEISEAMRALNALNTQARGLASTVRGLDRQFEDLYPTNQAARTAMERLEAASRRIEISRQTAQDLARTAASLEEGRGARSQRMAGAISASRTAEGETGAIQSSVQALGVLSEQLEGLQALMAAQSRLAAQEAATRAAERQQAIDGHRRNWTRPAAKPAPPKFNPLPNARN
ncbi:MAG: conjugal transfer protein TrbJ [Hyphomonadaceae bacterium]|jgi:P-type conjugative transfer protein TrbJ|nr:conjugal transfer protein TrbJ [Aquidulcibacter sp.]